MIQKLDPDSYLSPQKPKDLSILAKFKILKEIQSENPPAEMLNVTAKKSTFGKTKQNLSIDLGKIDVDLKNSSDQEALIKILQKETRKQKEIQFIERAVRSLKFFQDKKQDLTEKIYIHLLEKLKYEFIEREKPLFLHGDKGDKYYIVLKGELALLLPPKPFEEKKPIDPLALQRLKEKYYRVRDGESLMKASTNELRPSTPQTPRLIQIMNERFKGPMARLRCMSSVAKRKSITESGPSSPQTNSPNAGTSAINLIKQSSNKSSGFSTPTRARLLLLNSQDFETEREREQTSFDLYISAFFPQLNLATFFTEGAAFGEIALLRKTERSGTVVSKEDSHLMILDKESFDEVLGSWERQKTDLQIQFLKSYPFFSEVNEKYLMGMLHSLEMKTFVRGEIICEENTFPEFLYLVREGEVELSTECIVQTQQSDSQGISVTELSRRSQNQVATVRLSLLTAGSSICEDSIVLEQQTIGFQAKVCSTQAEIWLIDHSSFLQLLKQQRSFKRFQDHCQQNQDIRQRRIVKISATINSEASTHLKVTRYESKRNTAIPILRPATDYSKDSRFLDQMIQQSQNDKNQQIQQEKQLLSKKKLKQITSKWNYQPIKQAKSNNEGKSQEQLLYFNNSKDCGETSGKGSARDINVQELQQQQQQQYPSQFSISNRSCSGVLSEDRGQKSDRQEQTSSQEKGLSSDRKYNKLDKEKINENAISNEDKVPSIEGDFTQATGVIQSRNQGTTGQQQLLSLFSRSSDIERIHKTSLQKSNIFNQISKHSLVTQQQQQEFEEEIQHQKHMNNSSSNSDKPQPFLPFQKNLLFQPRLGNGLLREPFIDPFNPVSNNEVKSTCLSAREKPNESAPLFRSVSFQKITPISQVVPHEQHSHLCSPRSNFSTSINSVFSQLLKNQSVSAKNLTNFIDQTTANEQQLHKQQLQHKQSNHSKIKILESSQESPGQRRPSVPKILIKQQMSTPYLEDGVISPQEQQQKQILAKKKVSIVDHFIDQSPIQRLFGASIPFRSSESLPTLIQLKSHQELENKGNINNNLNKIELQPISERQSLLLKKKPVFENAYHLYSSIKSPQNNKNSSSTMQLEGFQKQYEDTSLSSRRIISTVNLNASENAFDHMRVLSTEEDLSNEEEDSEQATEKKFAQSTMENEYNPIQKHRQSASNLNRQEGTKNIHMEKLRLLNSKSLASLNSFTKAKKQFLNKSNCKDMSIAGNPTNSTESMMKNQITQETKNYNERTSKVSPKKQNITFTQSVFYDVNKPCVNSFFRPNPTLSRTLLQSSRSNSKNANNNCNNSNQQDTNNNNNNNSKNITPYQSNQTINSTESLRIHLSQATTSQDLKQQKVKSSINSSRLKNSSELAFQNSYFSRPSLTQRTTTTKQTPNSSSNNGSKLFGL